MRDSNDSNATVTVQQVQAIVKQYYNRTVQVKKLHGEIDLNFLLTDEYSERFVLKVSGEGEQRDHILFQNSITQHIKRQNIGFATPGLVSATDGADYLYIDINGGKRFVRMLTWIEGRILSEVSPHTPSLLSGVGELCASLCRALEGFDHPYAHRFIKWDPSQSSWTQEYHHVFDMEKREVIEYFSRLFTLETTALLRDLPMTVNYNDANDHNVIVGGDLIHPVIAGVIDFGDAVYTHRVNELAIAIAYAAMDKPDPLEAASHVVRGYNGKFALEEKELRVLYSLVSMRLVISVTAAALNERANPDNEYLQISCKPAWDLLHRWAQIHPDFAWYTFRDVCGLAPCPARVLFDQWTKDHTVLSPVVVPVDEHWLDMSVGSTELGNSATFDRVNAFSGVIHSIMCGREARMLLGRYGEARAIYRSDAFERRGNNGLQWRTVHLGVDFFTEAGTSVCAIADGTIHSLGDNQAYQDYGPTVIVEHNVSEELTFYTLYGHLSKSSLQRWQIGQQVNRGAELGTLGDMTENGCWPAHLHFQVILNMFGHRGDFPGVSTPAQRSVWTSVCPDPWPLITGKPCPDKMRLTGDQIVAYRKKHLGKNMSISYKSPLKIERGDGPYLVDEHGQKFLDTVNNVAHVGHEHPRIVRAAQRQMAVLNTNTRYLHENLVLFVEELLSTLPPPLNVAYVVNSGSEANELAMRLAKNFTGQQDMIVSEVGYHGNTNACVEISSYKFDGPGGRGKASNVHVIPLPDTYRGRYRENEINPGLMYARHVQESIQAMDAMNRKPAALIFESVISCGGQVELPAGFLKTAYALTRAAGGMCIADEVQTGCGRAGKTFWAFQDHDVIPDIVTIGKPIGNGHPLGVVVTTQAVAEAFNNGMEYFNTFGGNPVSCAVGLEVLRVIREEHLQRNADEVGQYLREGLGALMKEHAVIGQVRGPGLFLGIDLVTDRDTRAPATREASYVANRMKDKGILMSTDGPHNNVLKIKPPITFTRSHADFLLELLKTVLNDDFLRRLNVNTGSR